jgi:hypothetical protein
MGIQLVSDERSVPSLAGYNDLTSVIVFLM